MQVLNDPESRGPRSSREGKPAPGGLPLWLVTLLTALWLVTLCNGPLWKRVATAVEASSVGDYLFLGACFVSMVLAFNVLLTLVTAVRPLAKPVLIGVILIAATAAAFMQQYGVMLDRVMIQNVFETDAAEVRDLLSLRLVLWWTLVGLVPAIVIARLPVRARTVKTAVIESAASATGSFVALAAIVLAFGADYASLLRNHRDLRFLLTPTNALWYTGSYLSRRNAVPPAWEIVGADVRKLAEGAAGRKPIVLVMIVGEAARAEDFSLGGHEPETNPLLRQSGGVYFGNVTACGTSTAVSLPCMFSALGRSDFDDARARRRDNLLDIAKRAGVDVLWLDNNSGCKGICDRVPYKTFDATQEPQHCQSGECFDEVLVKDLRQRLAELRRDTLIVLHQKGSHGPAYYRRYPPAFERFTPACKSIKLSDCSAESLHNTYDNTILYTDFVVAQTIETLRTRADTLDSALLYVSDHGESLGEMGLYLHGAPYRFAPRVQVQVPLYAWFSEAYFDRSGLNASCIRESAKGAYSHDNLFHTTLALLRLETSAYQDSLDMFSGCRGIAGGITS